MSLGTPAAVLLGIFFLMPGFIWTKVGRLLSPYASTKKIELLECFAFSCFNYLVAFPVIFLLLVFLPDDLDLHKPETVCGHPRYLGIWLFLVFLLPVALAVGLHKLKGVGKVQGFLERLDIALLHPAPTAWDYAFARGGTYWAKVELVDDSSIMGLFDANSLASSEKEDHDLFLETILEWDESSGEYYEVDRNAGVWIKSGQIRKITFFGTDSEIGQDTEELPVEG